MSEPATGCAPCRQGWEHCHATLLVHPGGDEECTGDEDCRLGDEQHEVVVDCVEVGCGCGDG